MSTRQPFLSSGQSLDITTRRRVERVLAAIIELPFSIVCFGYSAVSPKPWVFLFLGTGFLWDSVRVLGWKLETTPKDLRVRRYFVWQSIPWAQIARIEVGDTWGRGQKAVWLILDSQPTVSLGAFSEQFALAIRDALRAHHVQRATAAS